MMDRTLDGKRAMAWYVSMMPAVEPNTATADWFLGIPETLLVTA